MFPASEITAGGTPPVADNEIDLRDPADPGVGGEDASSVEHRWTYGPPTDEGTDIPATTLQSASRPHSRWTTKQP